MDWLPAWVNQVGMLVLLPLTAGFLYHVIECSKKRTKIYDELKRIREESHEDYADVGKAISRIEGYLQAAKEK